LDQSHSVIVISVIYSERLRPNLCIVGRFEERQNMASEAAGSQPAEDKGSQVEQVVSKEDAVPVTSSISPAAPTEEPTEPTVKTTEAPAPAADDDESDWDDGMSVCLHELLLHSLSSPFFPPFSHCYLLRSL
jgi:hypothetical protein